MFDTDNDEATIGFYEKNGFQFLSDEDKDKDKDTRIMFFDLKRFSKDATPPDV